MSAIKSTFSSLAAALVIAGGLACSKPSTATPTPEKPSAQAQAQETARMQAEAEQKRKAEAEAAEAARKAAAAAEARKAEAARSEAVEAVTALKDIHFEYDRSDIMAGDKVILQAVADFMKAHAEVKVTVEGNCDERGTVEYNLALGERRAHAAQDYLVTLGVAADRLSTISFGKEKPKVEGHDDASWLINRRDEFKLQ